MSKPRFDMGMDAGDHAYIHVGSQKFKIIATKDPHGGGIKIEVKEEK